MFNIYGDQARTNFSTLTWSLAWERCRGWPKAPMSTPCISATALSVIKKEQCPEKYDIIYLSGTQSTVHKLLKGI